MSGSSATETDFVRERCVPQVRPVHWTNEFKPRNKVRLWGWCLTKSRAKEAATNIVIPSTVALALIAMAAKLWASPTPLIDPSIDVRIAAIETRQVELDRQYREDRREFMAALSDINGAVRRIEGKLEK